MSVPPSAGFPEGGQSPSSARRQLGKMLKALRELSALRLEDVGKEIQRSNATLSRLENGQLLTPRLVDVLALLDLYAEVIPGRVSSEQRERAARLVSGCRSKQWFESFRDVLTGQMTGDYFQRYIEYENDATEIRNFEPELIPGLLQTRKYARVMAEIFFPEAASEQIQRFVELRLARQSVLTDQAGVRRLHFAVAEPVVRRPVLAGADHIEQLQFLLDLIQGARPNVVLHIVSQDTTIPAALGGSFVHFTFGQSEPVENLVYLESRSGGNFLESVEASDRFLQYFDSLQEFALGQNDAELLLTSAINNVSR